MPSWERTVYSNPALDHAAGELQGQEMRVPHLRMGVSACCNMPCFSRYFVASVVVRQIACSARIIRISRYATACCNSRFIISGALPSEVTKLVSDKGRCQQPFYLQPQHCRPVASSSPHEPLHHTGISISYQWPVSLDGIYVSACKQNRSCLMVHATAGTRGPCRRKPPPRRTQNEIPHRKRRHRTLLEVR